MQLGHSPDILFQLINSSLDFHTLPYMMLLSLPFPSYPHQFFSQVFITSRIKASILHPKPFMSFTLVLSLTDCHGGWCFCCHSALVQQHAGCSPCAAFLLHSLKLIVELTAVKKTMKIENVAKLMELIKPKNLTPVLQSQLRVHLQLELVPPWAAGGCMWLMRAHGCTGKWESVCWWQPAAAARELRGQHYSSAPPRLVIL